LRSLLLLLVGFIHVPQIFFNFFATLAIIARCGFGKFCTATLLGLFAVLTRAYKFVERHLGHLSCFIIRRISFGLSEVVSHLLQFLCGNPGKFVKSYPVYSQVIHISFKILPNRYSQDVVGNSELMDKVTIEEFLPLVHQGAI